MKEGASRTGPLIAVSYHSSHLGHRAARGAPFRKALRRAAQSHGCWCKTMRFPKPHIHASHSTVHVSLRRIASCAPATSAATHPGSKTKCVSWRSLGGKLSGEERPHGADDGRAAHGTVLDGGGACGAGHQVAARKEHDAHLRVQADLAQALLFQPQVFQL